MIKIGETHSGKTIVNIERGWVKYRYYFGEGECTIDVFERRWVLPQAIKATEQPSEAIAEEQVYGNDCKSGNCS